MVRKDRISPDWGGLWMQLHSPELVQGLLRCLAVACLVFPAVVLPRRCAIGLTFSECHSAAI